jgi:hypothetical protein
MAVYGITENTDLEMSQLTAQEGAVMKPVVLKADCGDLSRGAVIERTGAGTGQWQEVSTDGGGDAAGILAEAVTNNAAELQTANAYVLGKFRTEDLIWPSGISPTNQRLEIEALADRGIHIEEPLP